LEFQLTIVLLLSPVALLVALWGMTNTTVLLLRQPLPTETQRHSEVQNHCGSVEPFSVGAA
jgi:hypothetical protein